MARITVEDCLQKLSDLGLEANRFALARLAARRAKELREGHKPEIDPGENKAVVAALREIAAGRVRFKSSEEVQREREASSIVGNGHDVPGTPQLT